jgi:hypothetical protein
MDGLEKGFPFCSNPDCELHVYVGQPGVIGSGNWAQTADGRMTGRGIHYGLYLCDACAREWRPVTTALRFA